MDDSTDFGAEMSAPWWLDDRLASPVPISKLKDTYQDLVSKILSTDDSSEEVRGKLHCKNDDLVRDSKRNEDTKICSLADSSYQPPSQDTVVSLLNLSIVCLLFLAVQEYEGIGNRTSNDAEDTNTLLLSADQVNIIQSTKEKALSLLELCSFFGYQGAVDEIPDLHVTNYALPSSVFWSVSSSGHMVEMANAEDLANEEEELCRMAETPIPQEEDRYKLLLERIQYLWQEN